jgi:hypothetical protein
VKAPVRSLLDLGKKLLFLEASSSPMQYYSSVGDTGGKERKKGESSQVVATTIDSYFWRTDNGGTGSFSLCPNYEIIRGGRKN